MLRFLRVGIALVLAAFLGCGEDSDNDLDAGPKGDGSGEGGPTSIASLIQEAPFHMVSDGTTLFWVTGQGDSIWKMPARGGAVTRFVEGSISTGFLAVDATDLYFQENADLFQIPKTGGTPTLLGDHATSSTSIGAATTLGPRAFWVEGRQVGRPGFQSRVFVKTELLKGGPISVLAQFDAFGPQTPNVIGLTSTKVFLSGFGGTLADFSIGSGVPDGGMPTPLPGVKQGCDFLISDDDAVYCAPFNGSIVRIASDGTTKSLGMLLNETSMGGIINVAIDATDLYWVDNATVGTIMRAPKAGGASTLLARDTSPIAIAVDDTSIYWSDQGGHIMRLSK